MKIARNRTALHSVMITTFSLILLRASCQPTGVVSSDAPGAGSAIAASSKPLPWKFLASPMGVLDSAWTNESFKEFDNPNQWDCKRAPIVCTPKKIKELVLATAGVDLDSAPPTYVALHVANREVNASTGNSDSWYLFHSKDKGWSYQKFTGKRIYGSPSILFVFVHLHVKGVTMADARQALASSQTAATSSDDPTKVRMCEKQSMDPLQWLGDYGVPSTNANVQYESAVVKRTPANVANLLSVLKVLTIANGKTECIAVTATNDLSLWGTGRIDNIGLPSDVSIAGYALRKDQTPKDEDRSKLQIGSLGSFNDEQLYWWDASIGIPVHKIKDLQYSSSDNTVVAAQVEKQSAYAMFNLMLHPADLSDPRSNMWPRILAGFPLASSPWDKLFAGGALGIPLKPLENFQFFAGATFNRSSQPTGLTAGSTANNAQLQNSLQITMTPKFTFGINVPVKSVLDKLLK